MKHIFRKIGFLVFVLVLFACAAQKEKKTTSDNPAVATTETKSVDIAALSFTEKVRYFYEKKDTAALKELIEPLKKAAPVFDSLEGTEEGDKYYALGKILSDLYFEKDTDALLFFLKNGASGFIEADEPIVRSYLFYAIEADDLSTVETLIQAGAQQNIYSELGNVITDMNYAATHKAYTCLEHFLKNGADPNAVTKTSAIGEPGEITSTVLYGARNDKRALKLLFQYGAKEGLIHSLAVPETKDGKTVTVQYNTYIKKNGDAFEVYEKTETE